MGKRFLKHYGTKRHSGRYPYGSGDNPYQHDKLGFYKDYRTMRDNGKSETDIAKEIDKLYFGGDGKFTTTKLRAWVTIGKEEEMAANVSRAMKLKETGMSNVAIGKEMGVNESVVRTWLDPARKEKLSSTRNVANALVQEVKKNKYLDVGKSSEIMLNCSKQKMDAAIALLEEEGYKKHYIKQEQQGNLGNFTWMQILTKDDVPGSEVYANRDQIKPLTGFQSNDGGKTVTKKKDPRSISSENVMIRYAEDGGIDKDGVMEIKPGVPELSLGNDQYAQVRIAVDGTHYLKGMAIYGKKEDFPKGVNIIFNTNKTKDVPMINKDDPDHQVLKKMKDDKDMPFGALTKEPENYISKDGTEQQSCINKVNSDEDWDKWSKNLASQFLGKQPTKLAKQQLGIAYDIKENEFETLKSLDNPTIKKKLLEEFADECDSNATHMKAAPLSGQATHVILPINNIKDTEIYAPNYKNGEEVVLVRYPHAGPFESPRLKVNNKNKEGIEVLGNAKHAVGINSKVAEQLSGADFDGDTVVVLPVRGQNIKTSKVLDQLKDFDPKVQYKAYDGMPRVGKDDNFSKPREMGMVSNLITDMTVAGAPDTDIAKAVKHSMVIIDAEKHNLNWKQSAIDNDYKYLQEKYQKKGGGATTILSQTTSPVYVSKRKEITSPSMMTEAELKKWNNGEKVYRSAEDYYIKPNISVKNMTEAQKKTFWDAREKYNAELKEYKNAKRKDPNAKVEPPSVPEGKNGVTFKIVERQDTISKMANTSDAKTLVSKHNTVMENIYADYANSMKRLALEARKEARSTGNMTRDPVAAKTYAAEVESIKDKIRISKMHAPKERQAQLIAGKRMDVYMKENPNLTKEEIKKKRNKLLAQARAEAGATGRERVTLTDKEVEAIKNGAISNNTMLDIFNNGDQDALKKSFTPKTKRGMTTTQISKAKRLLKNGYTQAEVAEALGVSVSTINKNVDF